MRITFIIHKKLDKAKECIWLADIFQKRVLIPRFYDILIFIDLWFSFLNFQIPFQSFASSWNCI